MKLSLTLITVLLAMRADCTRTSVGVAPLTDFTADYLGNPDYPGGLYPGGNARPAAHTAIGVAEAASVVPRDAAGVPSQNGRIGLIELGMSNAEQVAQAFNQQCSTDQSLSTKVRRVEACVFGKTLDLVANASDPYWTMVDNAVSAAQLTPAQVQVTWIMEAVRMNAVDDDFPQHVEIETDYWIAMLQIVKAKFPNLRLAYLESLQYMGYVAQPLWLDEPYGFEQGFAVRKVIELQINGDPLMALGSVPWVSWGVYFWNDGIVPRAWDGLTWLCPQDCAGDGVHLSPAGRTKLATMVRAMFKSDETTATWFLK